MTSENKFNKKIIIDKPELYPKLSKQIQNLDDYIETNQYAKKLGSYGITLNNLKKKSIYKKLLDIKSQDTKNNLSIQELREGRNKYLKKLVESNSFYFPKELGLDEYKKPTNPKEDKFNKILKQLEEIAKKEKINMDVSRKNSVNYISSRKDSLLENKRKRADSIYEELYGKNNKKQKQKQKQKQKENEENGGYAENEEENNEEDNDGGSYNANDEYAHNDDDDDNNNDDDSQNYNYSYDGNDDDY